MWSGVMSSHRTGFPSTDRSHNALICRICQASRQQLFKFTAIRYSFLSFQGCACPSCRYSEVIPWPFNLPFFRHYYVMPTAVIIVSVIPAFTQCQHNLSIALPVSSDISWFTISIWNQESHLLSGSNPRSVFYAIDWLSLLWFWIPHMTGGESAPTSHFFIESS